MDDLLAVLRAERQALEHLLYRLLEARSLLVAAETRFLHLAADDVQAAAERVREIELQRALLPVSAGASTLRHLAETTPPPVQGILEDHRRALGHLAAEVGGLIEGVHERCETGARALRHRAPLALVGREDSGGAAARPSSGIGADHLDREIVLAGFGALQGASRRLALPAFVAFLG